MSSELASSQPFDANVGVASTYKHWRREVPFLFTINFFGVFLKDASESTTSCIVC